MKLYYNFILMSDNDLTITERLQYYWKSLLTLAPIALSLEVLNLWFTNNKLFGTGIIALITVNMLVGGYMHLKKGNFQWREFIQKTISMVVVVFITYLVLELIISVAGDNFIVEGFRAVLQVATLLYPGSKILKNVFILSNGEHPPKWIMQKIYNFQENGDLKEFLNTEKSSDEDINKYI